MEIKIEEKDIIKAAGEGMDAFVELFRDRIMEAIGGELNAETMAKLSADQITLLAYMTVRDEVMDGGFIQLIHNGYGPFIFMNPFAKAIKQWGEALDDDRMLAVAKRFRDLMYKGRPLFVEHEAELTKDCTDEEFMALFEQYPEFDDLDDEFVEMEEEMTAFVATYVDEKWSAQALK